MNREHYKVGVLINIFNVQPLRTSAPAPSKSSNPQPTVPKPHRTITRKTNKPPPPHLTPAVAVPTIPMNGFMVMNDIKKKVGILFIEQLCFWG